MIVIHILTILILLTTGKLDFDIYAIIRGLISYIPLFFLFDYLIHKSNKFLRLILILIFSSFYIFNLENILVNGQHAYIPELLRFALDVNFVQSSYSLRLFLLQLISFAVLYIYTVYTPSKIYTKKVTSILMVILLISPFLMESEKSTRWSQISPLEFNVKKFYYNKVFQSLRQQKNSDYKKILPNESKPTINKKDLNVVLIFIEGLSQIANKTYQLDSINKLKDKYYTTDKFISSQFQTMRSLYSAYCGRYPNLSIMDLKPSIISQRGKKYSCLPEILNRNGYQSIFMQGASLRFYNKENFLRSIGFNSVIGNENYGKYYYRTKWGIDDRSLYKYAIIKLKSLKDKTKPFFLSLLTVTTHHPYPNYKENKMGDKKAAFQYASDAVSEFLDNLEKEGLRDNTLVIITGDEPASIPEQVRNPLANSALEFIAIPPKGISIDKSLNYFSHSDIARTILDAVGVKNNEIGGRNIFASYQDSRPLYFGSAHMGYFFKFTPNQKEILECVDFKNCRALSYHQDPYTTELFQTKLSSKMLEDFSKMLYINEEFYSEDNFNDIIYSLRKKEIHDFDTYSIYETQRVDTSGVSCIQFNISIKNLSTTNPISFKYNVNTRKELFNGKKDPIEIKIAPSSLLEKNIHLPIDEDQYVLIDSFLEGVKSKAMINNFILRKNCR